MRLISLSLFLFFSLCPALIAAVPESYTESEMFSMPQKVYFRTNKASFNAMYYFILKENKIFYKNKRPVTEKTDQWSELRLPFFLKHPSTLSVDDETLVVLDNRGNIFSMLGALSSDPDKFSWRRTWGFPFWNGLGFTVRGDFTKWDVSFISPYTDEYIQYANGNKHDVGKGCTTVFLLQNNGHRITLIDPWLVNDFSNEITTPDRGGFKAVNLSASGSRVFVINKAGEMYTLLFDFDISGMDELFFNYSYKNENLTQDSSGDKIVPRTFPRPLPIAGWVAEPGVPGIPTDRITILKNGKGADNHILIVEGMQGDQTGYFLKSIKDDQWRFQVTDDPLSGRILNPDIEDSEDYISSDLFHFEGKMTIQESVYKVSLPDFNPHAFYSTLILVNPEGDQFRFTLHHNGTIRFLKRDRGLTDMPLFLRGAIEIPCARECLAADELRDFVEVEIRVTEKWLKLKGADLHGTLLRRK